MSDEPKRRGRPAKADADRKGVNFTFRARRDLRNRLGAAADANGRSISEEIEARLEASFQAADLRAIVREEVRAALDEAKRA